MEFICSFIRYLKYLVEERSAKRIPLIKIQHNYVHSEKNVKEDEEFELKHGREDKRYNTVYRISVSADLPGK
jgi:hypothetical protein